MELASTDLAQFLSSSSRARVYAATKVRSSPNLCATTNALNKPFIYQILSGLCYVHASGFLHRDLKPANVLLFPEPSLPGRFRLKLADFGLGRKATWPGEPQSPVVQTAWYRAPEVFFGLEAYTNSLDVWSAGVILLGMCSLLGA